MGIFDRKSDKPLESRPTSAMEVWRIIDSAAEPQPTGTNGSGRTYVVVKGDSLSKIAKREYGDANKWRAIYEANKDLIKDPDLIYPGQELKVPGA